MTAWHRQALGDTAAWPRRLPAANDPVVMIASAASMTISVVWIIGWLLVLVRRAAGSFSESPNLAMPWLTVSVGLAIVAVIDLARRSGLASSWTGVLARAGTVLAVLAVMPSGATISERALSLMPLGIAVAGSLVAPLFEQRAGRHRGDAIRRDQKAAPSRPTPRPVAVATAPSAPAPAGFRQRVERFQTVNEGDRAIGRVIVDVPTGSRTGHAHVGFCPPFLAMPTVEVRSDDDGVEAVVTAAEVVPWGVRVECRLSEPAEEPLAIPVDILARYPG